MFAVVVTLSIKPECLADFMPLIQKNAASSLAQEPGCDQFDIATDPARPNEIFLYEVYHDAAAFEMHMASTHFETFDVASATMITEKSVKTYQTVIR